MKILGRELQLWLAVVAAVLTWLVGFQLDGLSAENAAWINTAVNAVVGIVLAWRTKPIAPTVFTYAVTSIAGLLASYGLGVSQEMTSTTNLVVLAVMGLVTRGQVSPAADAPVTGVLGNKVTT